MTRSLWSMRASTTVALDSIKVRPLSKSEVEEIRRRVQQEEDAGPWRCECMQCALRRLREYGTHSRC